MAGMSNKHKRPLPPAGGRGKKARRHGLQRAEQNGTASNGTLSQQDAKYRSADEASDGELDTLSVPDSATAYSALLSALSSTAVGASTQSADAAAGRRMRDCVPATRRSENHPQRSAVNDSDDPARQHGQRSDARQAAVENVPGAGRKPDSRKVADEALSLGADSSKPSAAAAKDPPLRTMQSDEGVAVEGVAAGAHLNGGGGWRLSLPDEDLRIDREPDPAQPGGESSADATPVQDFFDVHLGRCRPGTATVQCLLRLTYHQLFSYTHALRRAVLTRRSTWLRCKDLCGQAPSAQQ